MYSYLERLSGNRFHVISLQKTSYVWTNLSSSANYRLVDDRILLKGTITLIGATTENPSFEVISALLSRAQVYILKHHTKTELQALLDKAMMLLVKILSIFFRHGKMVLISALILPRNILSLNFNWVRPQRTTYGT